jgi:DNA-binding NarL/FixJ family response regulator
VADTHPPARPLTRRELSVLRCLAAGMNYREIGAVLFIAESTVKTHVARAQRAICARNKVHLVVLAVRTGQLDLGGAP